MGPEKAEPFLGGARAMEEWGRKRERKYLGAM